MSQSSGKPHGRVKQRLSKNLEPGLGDFQSSGADEGTHDGTAPLDSPAKLYEMPLQEECGCQDASTVYTDGPY